jgi:hypothetical protein
MVESPTNARQARMDGHLARLNGDPKAMRGEMREKKKRAAQRRRGGKELLARVNASPVPQEDMLRFAEQAGHLEADERDFEGHALVAIRLFSTDRNKGVSAMFRMEALARLLLEAEIPGWARPVKPDGLS